MDSTLVGFVRALRVAGAQASPAESIDAAEAMALLGYADRDLLKAALGLVLAKSVGEKEIHDRVFDQYFAAQAVAAPPPASQSAAQRSPEPSAGADQPGEGQDAEGASAEQSEAAPGPASSPRSAANDAALAALAALLALAEGADGQGQATGGASAGSSTALAMALQRAARQAGVDDIRFATQIGYYTGRMMQALGTAPLEARIHDLLTQPGADASAPAQAELQRLQAARERLRQAARAVVAQRFELYGKPATENFMTEVVVNRPLGRMAPADMERLRAAVARMAKRLAERHSRRRRVVLRGQLDIRRTMRGNAGHDGAPVNLVFKHKRRDKPSIVAICDVSGSVASYVRFLLLFLYALQGKVTDLRSFAFSDRLKDVTEALTRLPFDDAMALVLRELGAGSTDYGQALKDLQDQHWETIDRRTTVIVLGDGRSNHADPRLDIFAELAERAKRVLWLCPEPESRWGSGDSCMLQYLPFCTQVSHCSNAADLERAIDDTLAAYG